MLKGSARVMTQNRKAVIVALCIFVCSLTGCVKEYEQKDIANYIRDTYDIENFSVSKTYTVVEDTEGYEDRIWTVQMNQEPNLTFRVKDDYGWGMESVSNTLWSDYEEVVLEHLYKKYEGVMNELSFVSKDEESMRRCGFEGTYKNREELRKLHEEMREFYAYVLESEFEISAYAVFQMEHPLRNQCAYVIDDGDYSRRYEEELTDEDLWEAEKEYLLTCLDYRFEEQIADFTQEEIAAALEDYPYCIFIEREDGMAEKYLDLCANKYAYGISFATLYEILVREGIVVEGNNWHYSFVGADGNKYEISYDFCDYPYIESSGEHNLGYYYLKNGQQVPMGAFFYNHFTEEVASEITGLTLHVSR